MPKIIENGRLREMTQEEIDKTEHLPAPEPTPEERIKDLEEALELLLSGVTADE